MQGRIDTLLQAIAVERLERQLGRRGWAGSGWRQWSPERNRVWKRPLNRDWNRFSGSVAARPAAEPAGRFPSLNRRFVPRLLSG
ncbi:MAG: hypothetical protein ACO3B3_00165 [Cyanobium sp.]